MCKWSSHKNPIRSRILKLATIDFRVYTILRHAHLSYRNKATFGCLFHITFSRSSIYLSIYIYIYQPINTYIYIFNTVYIYIYMYKHTYKICISAGAIGFQFVPFLRIEKRCSLSLVKRQGQSIVYSNSAGRGWTNKCANLCTLW